MSISVKTYKPDGRLHREYTASILLETEEWIMVHVPAGSAIIDNIKETYYTQPRDCVGLINNHEYYNVFYQFGRGGVYHRLYVSLSTPAVWSGSEVSWTDLELNVIQTRHDPLYLDNVDEYAQMIADGLISKEVVDICERNTSLIVESIEKQILPFKQLTYGQVTHQVQRRVAQGSRQRITFAMLAAMELLPLTESIKDLI